MNIEELKHNFAVRAFPYHIIQEAMTLDPVDALHDMELALKVWRDHVDSFRLGKPCPFKTVVLCQEKSGCKGCQIYLEVNSGAGINSRRASYAGK